MNKTWVTMLMVLLFSLFSGCGKAQPEDTVTVGVAIPSADHGWTGGVVWWAEQTKKELEARDPRIRVLVATARDAAEQVDKVENLLVQGIQALVILPHEPGPLTAVCEQARRRGVYLVVVDRGLAKPVYNVRVAGDNAGFGRACALALAERLHGKGKILMMEGIPCPVNTDRVQAFCAVLSNYPNISILDSQPAYWDTEKGLKLMENYLQKHPQVDGVWTGDDDVLLGALQAYQESGRRDIRLFIGGGGSKTVIKMVADRNPLVPCDVTYPPRMIARGIEEALRGLQNRDAAGGGEVIVPAEVITADNAATFYFPESMY